MKITLYSNGDDPKTLNKTVGDGHTIGDDTTGIKIVQPCTVLAPTFVVDAFVGIEDYNYCYFDRFDRYYYMNVTLENHKAYLICTVDPLMSWNNSIKNLNCMIARNEFDYNLDLPDPQLPLKSKPVVYSRNDTDHSPFDNSTSGAFMGGDILLLSL